MSMSAREPEPSQELAKQRRRERIVNDIVARTGIDDVMIAQLVDHFYQKIRNDRLIGPIFEARIGDWDHHLGVMCRFWSSVILMSGEYHGNPAEKHGRLPVTEIHFQRWLALFADSVVEVCPPSAHACFIGAAERIAPNLARHAMA